MSHRSPECLDLETIWTSVLLDGCAVDSSVPLCEGTVE